MVQPLRRLAQAPFGVIQSQRAIESLACMASGRWWRAMALRSEVVGHAKDTWPGRAMRSNVAEVTVRDDQCRLQCRCPPAKTMKQCWLPPHSGQICTWLWTLVWLSCQRACVCCEPSHQPAPPPSPEEACVISAFASQSPLTTPAQRPSTPPSRHIPSPPSACFLVLVFVFALALPHAGMGLSRLAREEMLPPTPLPSLLP